MEETNKSLALLLVAAIIVSLGGTIVSLNKLGQLQLATVTGRVADTGTGYVQLNVTSQTTITFQQTTIDFGNGYVNASCNNCTMYTNSSTSGENYSNIACCLGNWYPLTVSSDTGLYFQNEGNTDLTVNLNVSADADTFIGGSGPSPEFQFIIKPDFEARAATASGETAPNDDTATSCADNWKYDDVWTAVNVSNPVVCASTGFKSNSSQDETVIDFRVLIPRTASAASKTATVTLTGTS